MLKFSGYPYLIRGQTLSFDGFYGRRRRGSAARTVLRSEPNGAPPLGFGASGEPERPNSKQSLRFEMTLEQAYPPEYWRVQCAFKDSMIH